ncbi:MAG: quinone-dependent dihydroorotate dehydrogenase [Zoogloeaceae bacterium]|jgi:dihydroorotate dehydrogenase|nr:quinone-dependent dihydroorotate dehydrogenase [Zoogloeaceae bacterium]
MLYELARPLLFALDPETAHDLTLAGLRAARTLRLPAACRPPAAKPAQVMGLTFPNRVGLAAGLDKNGACIEGLAALGFGHIEIGTVTPRPQPGNPRPRLFRLPARRAIINRMGFNNDGADALAANVERAGYKGILGINIGKNADTPIERAADDYLACLRKVYAHASYVTVNISSPNTRNLRQLQDESELDRLLGDITRERDALAQQHGRRVPLALKIAPDLDEAQIQSIADALRRHRVDAAIVTNTTLSREGVERLPRADESGGLSGAPLFDKATGVLGALARRLGGEIPLIGVGGVMNGKDARAKLEAGAQLVQLYTGLIYRGPALVKEAVEATRDF